MAGKILFIEDEHTDEGGFIQNALNEFKGIEGFKDIKKQVEIAENFEEAVRKIVAAGDGADYSWFFLDRNLSKFSDVPDEENKDPNKNSKLPGVELPSGEKIVFSEGFFQCFHEFEGDYLYFLLRKAGVPIEKICFLTGNDPNNDRGKSLQSTPFVFGEKTPEVIVKSKPDANQSAMSFVNDDSVKIENSPTADVAALVEKIGKTPQVQLRCKYSEIFKDEEKLKDIIGEGNSNKFLEVLEKIESKKICTDKEDGVVFRNMVENICAWLKRDGSIEPRRLLNNIDKQNDFAYSLNCKNFKCAYEHLLSGKKKAWRNQLQLQLPEWKDLQNALDNDVKLLPGADDADAADAAALLCYLNYYLQDCKDIPKYFIACLDHVYTLTSEFSAHGKCDIDVNDIPWRALADDMITILKWCVKRPPQRTTEVTLHFDGAKYPPHDFKVKGAATLQIVSRNAAQNTNLPCKIIRSEWLQ